MKILILLFGLALMVFQTDKIVIKGKVVDVEGNGIPGAQILEGGTSNGTITDMDGNFTINVKKGGKITISTIGFSSMSFEIKKKDVENVDSINNLVINTELGSLQSCCSNHSGSHCGNSFAELRKLSNEKSCIF